MERKAQSKKEENLIREFLKCLGEDPKREGLQETPKRVFEAYRTLLCGYRQDPKKLLKVFSDQKYDEMIVVKNIEFYSMCDHHLLPFYGKAHIGYIPNGKIIGLSKIPRLVDIYARRLQTQERLTLQIAQALQKLLKPKGVGVVLQAKHLCIMSRGVEKQNSEIVTSSLTGLFKKNFNTRTEFLKLIGK